MRFFQGDLITQTPLHTKIRNSFNISTLNVRETNVLFQNLEVKIGLEIGSWRNENAAII